MQAGLILQQFPTLLSLQAPLPPGGPAPTPTCFEFAAGLVLLVASIFFLLFAKGGKR